MPGFMWWVKTSIGFSLGSPLLFMGRQFAFDGAVTAGVILFASGVLVVASPHMYARWLQRKGNRMQEKAQEKRSDVKDRTEEKISSTVPLLNGSDDDQSDVN